MSDDFLSRWSRRKVALRKGEKLAEPPAQAEPAQPPADAAVARAAPPPEPLPPVESLTPESDFAPFMRPDVDPGVKREALKVLLRDPRFNVMDGLDVYIDDYSKPDPLPADWLGKLNQARYLGHYVEPTEKTEAEALEGGEEAAPELQKAMPEQPVDLPPPDTGDSVEVDRKVRESGDAGNSIP